MEIDSETKKLHRFEFCNKTTEKHGFFMDFADLTNLVIWGIRGTFAEPSGRSTSDLENIKSKLSKKSKIMQIGPETKKLE